MASEKPIIFSGPMVRAIRAGEKTQTRRLHPKARNVVGDVLYVRHVHWLYTPPPTNPKNISIWDEFTRAARWPSGELTLDIEPLVEGEPGWKKRPSIHMPRWAARIWLEVTAVRQERLQDISEADILAEGVETAPAAAAVSFIRLWDSLNAKRGPWKENPMVQVYTFRRCEHD